MKRIRPHHYRSKGDLMQQRTQKMIEQLAQKENFFQEVMQKMQKEFEQEHLQLLIQHLQSACQNAQRRKNIVSNSNLTLETENEKISHTQTQEPQEIPFRQMDTALFSNLSKRLFPVSLQYNSQEQRKHLSTPKNFKNQEKMILPRKIFEVDSKMRRNYDRIKQRLAINNGDDSFRAINSIRSSLTVGRPSKTQRAMRFKTQGQQGERWIPRMLMGDLQLKPKDRKINTREDRRMECFLSRYKINQ